MSNKDYFKSLANDVMLEFTDAQLSEIEKNVEQWTNEFAKVTKINTNGVKPLFYPYDEVHYYLRNDDESQVMDQKQLLNNAPAFIGDFVTIVKVVK